MVIRFAALNESGLVDYTAFFAAIGVTLKPDDSCGVSTQIADGSEQTSEVHRTDQQYRYCNNFNSYLVENDKQ
jgi:hypothetical protein